MSKILIDCFLETIEVADKIGEIEVSVFSLESMT